MWSRLIELLSLDRRPYVLVFGDAMLDRYVWGEVDRISPEAPIPVLRAERREDRLGGAGSVAAMLTAMSARVSMASVVGSDVEGQAVRRLLEETGVDTGAVLAVADRPTTVKERLLGRTHSKQPQQMIRVDREQTGQLPTATAEELLGTIQASLGQVDLVLVSDYEKGVCAGDFVGHVVEAARSCGVAVVADPVRGVDFARYGGCTAVTPNRTEASMALGMAIATPADGLEAARRMLDFGIDSAVVTLDRDGIAWADRHGNARLFPVRARAVYDITGAGDMVLSALGYALAAGSDWPTAVELANLAGGLEVERLGVVPISRRELLDELRHTAEKGLSIERLEVELNRRRRQGQQIAMTNGCFDLLHPGHVASLQAARDEGDCLVVGLNSDRSARELKGPGHPIVDQDGRAAMLTALECVDYVVLFDDPSVARLIEQILPDVLVKAAQYTAEQIVGHETVDRNGGRVVRVPMKGDYSTTRLIEKLQQSREPSKART